MSAFCKILHAPASQNFDRDRDERACHGECTRLKELKDAGASVYLCSGDIEVARSLFGRNALVGYFHVKAISIDGKIAYQGSANFTRSSRKNTECVARYVGKPAKDLCLGLASSRNDAVRL